MTHKTQTTGGLSWVMIIDRVMNKLSRVSCM